MSTELQNSTVVKDDPITGGKTEVVINQLQVRQAIRTPLDVGNYKQAIQAAESRYSPNFSYLYDIYKNAELDGHLTGIVSKRVGTVLNKPLFYKDARGEVVEDLNQLIQSYEFRQIMRAIMESVTWGRSGLEFVPGKKLEVRQIPRKHINMKTQQIVMEQNQQTGGIDYTKLDNVWIIGEPEDLGLYLQCALYVIYKRNAMGDWSKFIEIFGMPIRIAKYDAYDETTKAALQDVLENTGSALAMLIPKTADFTLEDGKTSNANGDLQASFIELLNGELSITVLGNTETTGSGKNGSNAKSKTHSDQQNQIAKSDIALLQAYLNDPHFIRILQSYGIPVFEDGNFEFNKDIDIDFLLKRSEVDKNLAGMGALIPQSYIGETYSVPEGKEGEHMMGSVQTNTTEDPLDTTKKKAAPKKAAPKPPQDLADNIDYDKLAAAMAAKLKDTNFFG